jgi:hypothetical protein
MAYVARRLATAALGGLWGLALLSPLCLAAVAAGFHPRLGLYPLGVAGVLVACLPLAGLLRRWWAVPRAAVS